MARAHDRASRSLGASSTAGRPILCQESGADPLSHVLRMVKLTGAVFHLVEASFPWGVEIPPARAYAPIILPGAQHIVSYHIVLKGAGWVVMPGMAPARFEAGEILVLTQGEAYSLLSSPRQVPEYDADATIAFFREWASGKLPFVTREGGGGADGAEYVCGFLGCDLRPFNPMLRALPPLIRVKRAAEQDVLGRLLDLALAEGRLPRVGGESIRLRLSELIFIEVLRRCLEALAAHETGWLSGLRDPAVGKALAALHERPAHAWRLHELAQEAGMSRAAFAARFAHLLGQPPMEYLTLWRMQMAARLLADGATKVAAVGREVGYDSEAAFSRAFKKIVGVSPAAWRASAARDWGPSEQETGVRLR
jgi:AraC-like DNA-binding protein